MKNEEKLNGIFEELKPLTHEFMLQMFAKLDEKNIVDGEKSYMYMCLLSYMVKVFHQAIVNPDNIEEALETFLDTIQSQILVEAAIDSLEEVKKEVNINQKYNFGEKR